MIDWGLAERVSRAVASNAAPAEAPHAAFAEEVEAFAARSAELVSAYTGLSAPDGLPQPETVDRDGWATINLRSIRTVLEPVVARQGEGLGPLAGPVRAMTGMLLAVEVGALSGFLAARVLGQYEFPVTDPEVPARLLFVGPNLAQAASSLEADDQALTRWVALHETTHALQFGGVPWLRSHMASRITELMTSIDVTVDMRSLLRLPRMDDLRALADAVRTGELVTFVAGPERRARLDELQGTMALLEGYAEHVMDAVGLELLPDLPHLREGLERRRRQRGGVLRVLERLIGLELKLRQYEQGKAFCDAVVAEGGIDALNRAWSAPEALPGLAELDDPSGWLRRVAA
ncbi:MAG: zinc-dependent metalloprotease [Solirubrobacteraceae bacterium]